MDAVAVKSGDDLNRIGKVSEESNPIVLEKRHDLSRLLAATAALPCLGAATGADAQTPPYKNTLQLEYYDYQDYQSGSQGRDRIRVQAPMVGFEVPIGESWAVDGGFVLDSVSGASPLYLNTLSGASGLGINDTRRAGDLNVTKYFDDFSIALGGSYSDEDDYTSAAGQLETKIWRADRNQVLTLGVSGGSDDITSSNDPDLDESRNTFGYLVGFSQVIDPQSLVQVNLSMKIADGYMTDPYKSEDNRPQSRDQYALLTRYIRFLECDDSSIHFDYRYAADSWEIASHMLEVNWYRPLGDRWMLRPTLRYYTQKGASFFSEVFPPPTDEQGDPLGFYTADQRLSSFGSISAGLKTSYEIAPGYNVFLLYTFTQQSSDLKLGGDGSDAIYDFYSRYIGTGLNVEW